MAGFSFAGGAVTFENLAQALVLATLNKALLDFLAEPVLRKYPQVDLWWLNYVALATGFLIGWFAGVDFLTGVLVVGDATVGRILSCLAVGAGTSLINRVFVGSSVEVPGMGLAAGPAPRKYRGW